MCSSDLGAIETLTQANVQGMEPGKVERMIRTTSAAAKAAGIEMPEMFRLMGSTAAYADQAGVNRVFAPGATVRATAENQAMKNIFGGTTAFGLPTADKMLAMSSQLNIQAAKSPRSIEVANIARAIESFGVKPQQGSELEAVYKIGRAHV